MKFRTTRQLLAVFAACMFAEVALAQDEPAPAPPAGEAVGPAPAASAHLARPLPPERNWRFGLGLGYGTRTNPLVLSDDIPVIVDIDLAWFGKRWFIDNFDLGFELVDNRWFTTNAVLRVN